MSRPIMECGHCQGMGWILLPQHLVATLAAIGRGPTSIPEAWKRLVSDEPRLKVTAVNNRVRVLESIGLVRKDGKRDKAVLWVPTR